MNIVDAPVQSLDGQIRDVEVARVFDTGEAAILIGGQSSQAAVARTGWPAAMTMTSSVATTAMTCCSATMAMTCCAAPSAMIR